MSQKKIIIKWLNNKLTKKYFQYYKNHRKELKEQIFNASLYAFVGKGIKERSEEEISIHTRIVALDLIINDFEIIYEFLNYCEKNDLNPEVIPDEYEIELPNGQKETRTNPLTIFINNFYNQ